MPIIDGAETDWVVFELLSRVFGGVSRNFSFLYCFSSQWALFEKIVFYWFYNKIIFKLLYHGYFYLPIIDDGETDLLTFELLSV